jgi:hypothetical protein
MYWRKANQIHSWFIEHCNNGNDECIDIPVSREQLQELYDTCVLVRDNSKLIDGKIQNGYVFQGGEKIPILEDGKTIADSSVAADLLPSQSGFFFGSTDYDEYYLNDILQTIEALKPELEREYEFAMDEPEYYYRPSW